MNEIILATSNPGKLRELHTILHTWDCIPQTKLGIDDAEETGLSFIENALIKARHASLHGNKAALADDSGLVVPALNGAPGIYSARFAGENAHDEENIQLLLQRLKGTPPSQRQAYYYCAIAVMKHAEDPTPIVVTGSWHGVIIDTPMGHNGFGYDPIFYVNENQCTVAQLPLDIKNKCSHRAKALQQLLLRLQNPREF